MLDTLLNSGEQLLDPNCGDIAPATEIVDLNGDGTLEVFVSWGNTCTSGMTGRSLTLFVKAPGGDYEPQFGFPALAWSELDSRTQSWPDLSFGGPGFCHPVWRWDVSQYAFKCNLPETPEGCASRSNICESP